jgi:hypothetical protein
MLVCILALLVLPATLLFADAKVHERTRSRSRSTHAPVIKAGDETSLDKRDSYGGRATFYDVGLGACGGYK